MLNRPQTLSCRPNSRGGFTLVELLVVIGIIALLAGVALGPITGAMKTAQHNTGMQNSRSIALLLFQYSVDNDGTYPVGAAPAAPVNTSEAVAQNLLTAKYVNDPTIFYLAAPSKAKYTGNTAAGTFADFKANNISWNFMSCNSGGTITGVTTSASDLLPVVWCAGNTPVVPPVTAGNATALTLAAANPYSLDGVAVTYKSNSAVFLKADATGKVQNFISAAYNDPTVYQEIKP